MHYDVFNGDADGIIALLQLRLSKNKPYPKESILITGVKRDISLLKRVEVETATSVTVLDVSLEKNSEALRHLLKNEVSVFYVDHHRAGDIPSSECLKTIINTDANTCTSLLINNYLNDEFVNWAVAAAYGDNMLASAEKLAKQHNLNDGQQALLNELGIYINYNGYGRTVDDLHFAPDILLEKLSNYKDPFDLINESGSVFHQLKAAYLSDMAKAKRSNILFDHEVLSAVQLADEPWARRVSGVFGNELANKSPNKAHAVVTLNAKSGNETNTYTISLRAPLNNKQGAGDLCANYPTGGGRAAAAGINALPEEMLSDFFDSVAVYYS